MGFSTKKCEQRSTHTPAVLSQILSDSSAADASQGQHMGRLASVLNFSEYCVAARSLWSDQAFWRFLLPKPSSCHGVAVVIESRIGSISMAMAAMYDRVAVAHTDARVLELTKTRVGASAAPKFHFVQMNQCLSLPFSSSIASAVILFDIEADIFGLNIRLDKARYMHLLHEAARIAAADGIVVVGANNRDSYYLWKDNLRRLAGLRDPDTERPSPRLKPSLKSLDRNSFKAGETFIGTGLFKPTLDPMPELSNMSYPHRDKAAQKGRAANIRNCALKTKIMLGRWPSFLAVRGRQKTPTSFLEELLVSEPAVRDALGWAPQSRAMITRLIAGNANTAVAVAKPSDDRGRHLVIRLPSNETALERCESNALALTLLRSSCLSDVIPTLLSRGCFDGQPYFIESKITGDPVSCEGPDKGGDEMIISACKRLAELQASSAQIGSSTKTHVLAKLLPWLGQLPDTHDYGDTGHTAAVRDFFEKALDTVIFPMVPSHGDWKTGNLLFGRERHLEGIIDWENFESNGLPVLDFLLLLTYKLAKEKSGTLSDVFVRNLLPWDVPKNFRDFIQSYISALNIDDYGFALLRAIFWVTLLNQRFDRIYSKHEAWTKALWMDVWPHIQKQILSYAR